VSSSSRRATATPFDAVAPCVGGARHDELERSALGETHRREVTQPGARTRYQQFGRTQEKAALQTHLALHGRHDRERQVARAHLFGEDPAISFDHPYRHVRMRVDEARQGGRERTARDRRHQADDDLAREPAAEARKRQARLLMRAQHIDAAPVVRISGGRR